MRIKQTFLVLFASLFVGCGFIGDGDSRHGALSPHDDVILDESGQTPTDTPNTICEYPTILSGGGHAVDLRDCLKLEGGQLGDELVLDVHGETVVVDGWMNKDGEGDYIGFNVDGDVVVVVKAGTELHEASSGEWVHPAGTSGPAAKGISFVAFCEPPTDEPVCTPTDDGDPRSGGPTPSGGDGTDGGSGSGDDGPTTSGGDDGTGGGGSGDDGGTTSGGDDDGAIDDGGTSSGDGSGGDDGSGGSTTCTTATCSADTSCGDNAACVNGCCSEVIL